MALRAVYKRAEPSHQVSRARLAAGGRRRPIEGLTHPEPDISSRLVQRINSADYSVREVPNVAFWYRIQPKHPSQLLRIDTIRFLIRVSDQCEFAGMSNCHIQMFGERIVDVVVVAGCLNRSFGSSISLCEVIEVRVTLDPRLRVRTRC